VRRSPIAIDLFAGCGGFSTGLLDAGIPVAAGFDHDRRAVAAFDYNHLYRGCRGFELDLTAASGADLLRLADVARVDLVVGGPPCQAFSVAGKQRGLDDDRGGLVFDFARLVSELHPQAFVFENVPNLAKVAEGAIFKSVCANLSGAGYTVRAEVLNAADYGVPQGRKRLVVVGILGRKSFPFPPAPTHAALQENGLFGRLQPHVTCSSAISDLPDVTEPAARDVSNHEPTLHSPSMLAAFADLPPGERDRKSFHDRLHPDRPSYTLRAGSGNFSPLRPVHYRYDRVITVRESARLQGFTDDFIWPDSIPRLQQYRQVGNAVAPPLARRIGEHLAGVLGWQLTPATLAGDPTSRPPSCTKSFEERAAERLVRIRGASHADRAAV
jgi:DNA (cytosine-5)-methyltransferase 1